ncbi:hypothetical protein BDV11DRAFT_174638 [Aspergillus similis]
MLIGSSVSIAPQNPSPDEIIKSDIAISIIVKLFQVLRIHLDRVNRYSEAYCHLCGVSFNIARYRKAGEPEIATWDYTGDQGDGPAVEDVELEACRKNGCTLALWRPKDGVDGDAVNDPDFEPVEMDFSGDPYECDSEYESADAMSVSEDEEESEESSDRKVYEDFLSRIIYQPLQLRGEPVGAFAYSTAVKMDTLVPITSGELPENYESEDLEHLPGPACGEANAYSGAAISLAEMRGCRTAQFLVHKSCAPGGWQPDGLHEAWEMTEDWFLSGVCDGMASRDSGYPTVWPARGGLEMVKSDNVNFDPRHIDSNELAMPLHPWCFDIFSRQSRVLFNKVNVAGLMKWRNAECSYEAFHEFPRTADVFEAQEQFWRHVPGREYLSANPLYVPGLPALLRAAAEEDGTTDYKTAPASTPSTLTNRMVSLPLDIRLHIIDFLDPADITRLRAVSKAFAQLPNSVWYRLIREEMPWLWEAWDVSETDHTPSPWTELTANEVRYFNETRKRYCEVLRDEPTTVDAADEQVLPCLNLGVESVNLPKAGTNWHRVYTTIKRNWACLKGLRNRQRIWEDVAEIIRRIQKYEAQ